MFGELCLGMFFMRKRDITENELITCALFVKTINLHYFSNFVFFFQNIGGISLNEIKTN